MSSGASGSGCVFCELVAGREPASVVYSHAVVLAFLDIAQINTGHRLMMLTGGT
jgi:histidine triad (HIT) family protein